MSIDIVLRDEFPDDPQGRVERRLILQEAIEELTPKQREALALWMQGYTQEEIGERVGITQRTVGRRLERAFKRIREYLT